ncbi:MAG: hypothetical protein AB7E49_05395 [Campylobacterales bacterium]
MKLKSLALYLLGATAAFAAEGGEIDLLQRVVNFAIFAGLVYYLFANTLKNFFGQRSSAISAAFERAQDRVKEARQARETALRQLEEAKIKAEEIISVARQEASMLSDRVLARGEEDLKLLHKQKEESMTVSGNRMVRTVVTQTMGDILAAEDLLSDQELIMDNMMKRVA